MCRGAATNASGPGITSLGSRIGPPAQAGPVPDRPELRCVRGHSLKIAASLGLVFLLGLSWVWLPVLAVAVARRTDSRVLFTVPTTQPVVALTIDDGPSAATEGILEVLRAYNARATFFLIGDNTRDREPVARRIVAEGHEVAHHMMKDEPSIRLPAERFREQFQEMHAILADLGGVRWFRPGSGWYDRSMVDEVERRGYRVVLGSVYPFDAQISAEPWLAGRILASVEPGDVIVLHDGERRGQRTARVLRTVLEELQQRGFRVVTVTELMACEELVAVTAGARIAPAD